MLSRRRKSGDAEVEEQSFEILVPQIGHVSKLEKLALVLDKSTGIVLDENFWGWVGSSGSFKEFNIAKVEDFDSSDALFSSLYPECAHLTSFLKNSGASLTDLHLIGFGLSSAPMPAEIQLHQLHSLRITGNMHLINLFIHLKYSSLQSLTIQTIDESSEDIDHLGLLHIMESCQSTLEKVTIGKPRLIPEAVQEAIEHETYSSQITFTSTKVSNLDLTLEDSTISQFYLKIKYPNLKKQ